LAFELGAVAVAAFIEELCVSFVLRDMAFVPLSLSDVALGFLERIPLVRAARLLLVIGSHLRRE
jgi:hypothetical protein